jgi:hypothetical protein
MKKLNSLFKISLVLLATLIMVSCQKQVDYGPQIQTLTNSVSALQSALNSSLAALQKSRDSLTTALAQTNASLTSTNVNVSNLGLRMDSVKSALVGINTQLSYLSSRIDSANTKITLLNTQMAAANSNISSINAQIVVINSNIANFTNLINTLNQQYSSLLSTLNGILAQLYFTPNTLTNGLVAWYPFTGNLIDSSVNANNFTNSNAVLTTDRFGTLNSAYYFNNAKNSYAVSNNIPITLTGPYTFSFWQNFKSFNEGASVLELIRNSSTIANLNPAIWQHNNKLYLTTCTNSNNQMLMDTTSNLLNKWVNFTWTVSAGVTNLYENGILIASSNSMPWPTDATTALTLGNNANSNIAIHSQPSNVSFDEIRIYNRVLTSSEIYYIGTH